MFHNELISIALSEIYRPNFDFLKELISKIKVSDLQNNYVHTGTCISSKTNFKNVLKFPNFMYNVL